jgi:hypothetical protein
MGLEGEENTKEEPRETEALSVVAGAGFEPATFGL